MIAPARIRRAERENVSKVLALERATAEAPHWAEAVYRDYVADDGTALQRKVLFVAMREEELRGFAAASLVGDEAELESIAVDPHARRSGLGSRLLDAVKDWARRNQAHALRLELRSTHAEAEAFYVSQGFVREGLRRAYYQAPVDAALLMRHELLPAAEAGETAADREL